MTLPEGELVGRIRYWYDGSRIRSTPGGWRTKVRPKGRPGFKKMGDITSEPDRAVQALMPGMERLGTAVAEDIIGWLRRPSTDQKRSECNDC